jgi:hypothetical protein
LGVTGVTTLTGSLNANGGITGDNFEVADGTGNTSIGGTLGVTNTTTLTGNVGIGGASGTETLLVTGSERITGNLDVSGDLTVTGNFNFSEVIQNITTVNNEVIISTQLDISNQGTGPALKVSQFGVGEDQDVAVFNAGDEGDAFKIDYAGNSHFYKPVEMDGSLDVSGATTLTGALQANGGFSCEGTHFAVANDSGNTSIGGTLVVTDTTTLNNKVTINSNELLGQNSGSMIFNTTGSNQQSSILFRSGNDFNDYGYIKYDDTRTVGGSGTDALLTIGIENDSNDHIAIMPGAGNVGIGITAPTSKLHVNGTLNVTGNTTMTGTLSIENGWRVPHILAGYVAGGSETGTVTFSKSFASNPSVVCNIIYTGLYSITVAITARSTSSFSYRKRFWNNSSYAGANLEPFHWIAMEMI